MTILMMNLMNEQKSQEMMNLMNEQKSQEMMKLMNEQVKVSGDGGREGNWPTIVRPTPRPSYQVSIFHFMFIQSYLV